MAKILGHHRPSVLLFFSTLAFFLLLLSHLSLSSAKVGNKDLSFLKTDPELGKMFSELSKQLGVTGDVVGDESSATGFGLATKESGNFFTDVPNNQWKMLKAKAHSMLPNTRGNPMGKESSARPAIWFQQHFEPEFVCPLERRIGRLGDGGKWICDPHRITQKESDCLVYSIGSNGDASFEAAILQDISEECEIHVFDMDNFAESVLEQTNHSPRVHYHQWGISSSTSGKFKTLHDTVKALGHEGRTVDIFKVDCEGCELDTYSSWLEAPIVLKQVVVEIHPIMKKLGSSKVKLPETVELFQGMRKKGYVITHKEPNVQFALWGLCVEYNFLLISPEFWKG